MDEGLRVGLQRGRSRRASGRTGLLIPALLLCLRGAAPAGTTLTIFGGAAKTGEAARVAVEASHTDPLEGFRLALRVKPGEAKVLDLTLAGTASAGAERAILKVLGDGATLDVLLDAEPPFGGRTIPPGQGQPIAYLKLLAVAAPVEGDPPVVAAVDFVEEAGGAPFPASVRVGGREVRRADGLELVNGFLSIFPVSSDTLSIPDVAFDCLARIPIAVPVLLTNASGPVEGFTLSVAHDPAKLVLRGITIEDTVTAEKLPEFVQAQVYHEGGTLAVVLDLFPPFEGQVIPRGNARPIARLLYDPVEMGAPARPTVAASIDFVEGIFGDPAITNLIVVGGESRRPATVGGKVTLYPCDTGPIQFCVGAPGPDGSVISPVGYRGQDCLRVSLFYRSPFFLQGLQMALAYDECFTGIEGSLELVNPEALIAIVGDFAEKKIDFLEYHFDNSRADGDGRELVLGLLVEATPPFEDKRLRDSDVPLEFARFCFKVCDTVVAPAVLAVEFREGLNGRGTVRIFNRAVVDNFSVRPEFCQKPVLILERPPPGPPGPEFVRGDCNGSLKVDISDAAAVAAMLGYRHPPPGFPSFPIPFVPPCEDACDANDDGRVDLADMVAILRYLFKQRVPFPPPGADMPGLDPTEDKLTCKQ